MKLSNENLTLVIEECAEVIKACTKIMRFGPDENHPDWLSGKTNAQDLIEEIGQLAACFDRLDLPMKEVNVARKAKKAKLKVYGPEGTHLTDGLTPEERQRKAHGLDADEVWCSTCRQVMDCDTSWETDCGRLVCPNFRPASEKGIADATI